MASVTLAPLSLLICIFLLAMPYGLQAGDIVTYWGQFDSEGSLAGACMSRNYKIVNIAFLSQFGSGRSIKLNLNGHCSVDGCAGLSNDIRACQGSDVKVFLSIGGPGSSYSLSSAQDARDVATKIWNQFLAGSDSNSPRPLGDAILDGVDFFINQGSTQYWDVLAEQLMALSGTKQNLYLSASPGCRYPDQWLNSALRSGHFHYIWIRFYNNRGCEYDDNADNLRRSWQQWTNGISTPQMYLGLPASPEAADSGYILPNTLKSEVLPVIKGSPNYGGIMLWSIYFDHEYSQQMKPFV